MIERVIYLLNIKGATNGYFLQESFTLLAKSHFQRTVLGNKNYGFYCIGFLYK